jgi:hypothetical protein
MMGCGMARCTGDLGWRSWPSSLLFGGLAEVISVEVLAPFVLFLFCEDRMMDSRWTIEMIASVFVRMV